MTSALCQLLTSPNSLSFFSWSGCFINRATQIAACLAKTASLVIVWVVPEVVQPPHAKPMIIEMTAPQIRPQTPYFTFAAVSGFIDKTSRRSLYCPPYRAGAGAPLRANARVFSGSIPSHARAICRLIRGVRDPVCRHPNEPGIQRPHADWAAPRGQL